MRNRNLNTGNSLHRCWKCWEVDQGTMRQIREQPQQYIATTLGRRWRCQSYRAGDPSRSWNQAGESWTLYCQRWCQSRQGERCCGLSLLSAPPPPPVFSCHRCCGLCLLSAPPSPAICSHWLRPAGSQPGDAAHGGQPPCGSSAQQGRMAKDPRTNRPVEAPHSR